MQEVVPAYMTEVPKKSKGPAVPPRELLSPAELCKRYKFDVKALKPAFHAKPTDDFRNPETFKAALNCLSCNSPLITE
jgi:hypothetical protein